MRGIQFVQERTTARISIQRGWAALLALTVFLLAGGAAHAVEDGKPDTTAPSQSGRALLGALQDAFVSVADQLRPTVVTITAHKTVRPKVKPLGDEGAVPDTLKGRYRTYRAQGTGSGVIISSDGWIITNDHVVSGSDTVTVKLQDGREFEGTVRRDYRSDLAVIKIGGSTFPYARLGNSDNVKVGQWAIAIGSPYKYEGSFSVGVISALGRHQEIRDQTGEGGGRLYPDMFQTDAAINPGNSGGPLINLDGEIIGINTAIESENGGGLGIGFALPMNAVKFVVEQLRDKGKVEYGYLGVEPETVTPRVASLYKVEAGALVKSEPEATTPAGKAGIHVEDVITRIDDAPVRSEWDYRIVVSRTPPGTTVNVTLQRNGVEKSVKATIVAAPPIRLSRSESGGTPTLGVEVASLTSETAARVGLAARSGKAAGVVIKSVDTASSASETELQAGDVILAVNGVQTPTVEAFRKATVTLRAGDTLRILWQGKRYPDTIKRVSILTID